MLILLALQAAQPATAAVPSAPERFSILAPPAPGKCRAPGPASDDIVVCATPEQRLPLPAERGPPDRPVASNPNLDGLGALDAARPVCAAQQGGCQVGVDVFGAGTAAIRLVQKLVAPGSCCEEPGEATNPFKLVGDTAGGVRRLFARRPDRSNRVAIDLSDPPPPPRATP